MPSAVTRDRKNGLLIDWSFLRFVPPQFYVIAFVVTDSGKLRAVPDDRLALDGYPEASRTKADALTAAGFRTREDLRLVMAGAAQAAVRGRCMADSTAGAHQGLGAG